MQSEILCRNRKLCPHCIIQSKNIWKMTTYKGWLNLEYKIREPELDKEMKRIIRDPMTKFKKWSSKTRNKMRYSETSIFKHLDFHIREHFSSD